LNAVPRVGLQFLLATIIVLSGLSLLFGRVEDGSDPQLSYLILAALIVLQGSLALRSRLRPTQMTSGITPLASCSVPLATRRSA
jgi:hypothetical protein